MKKIFILILLAFITFSMCGCGLDMSNRQYIITNDGDAVAKFTIITFDGKGEGTGLLANLGHSFLALENVSSNNLQIKNHIVEPNEMLVFGTWSVSEHYGIWFNLESNYIAFNNKYDGRISISQLINSEKIDAICEYIENNDYWSFLENCSCFALHIWNEISTDTEKFEIPLIYTPLSLAKQIKQFEGYEINKPLITDTEFGYYKNNDFKTFHFEGV